MRTGKPLLIAGVPIAGLALHSWNSGGGGGVASAWAPAAGPAARPARRPRHRRRRPPAATAAAAAPSRPSAATALSSTVDVDVASLHLTPELEMMTNAFASIPDEKTRHKQLLHMASRLPAVDDAVRVPENKVPGCLSTVHVDCSATKEEEGGDWAVNYVGDSDGLLTKGLLALLIRGLSGCTPEQIEAVDPKFVQAAKISQTLTPGRNNGFLNMLAVMKKKASDAVERADGVTNGAAAEGNVNGDAEKPGEDIDGDADVQSEGDDGGVVTTFDPVDGKPMYNAILSTLISVLKPTSIRLADNSSQHAGHAGSKGWEESGESHFALEVVAEAFEGLNLVKRHQLIYMLLGEVMPKIHALEISAKSTSEVE
ncbi:hypothetical protein ACHAWF_018228 [Thalassiosira exigua]